VPKNNPSERHRSPPVYPFQLSAQRAKELVRNHASEEFESARRMLSPFAEFNCAAEVRENGDVELFVHHKSDDGVVMSSGTVLRKVLKPYSAEELEELKAERMFAIAEAEYFRRQREKERQEIKKIQAELFGTQAVAVTG
jgi:hypothetical protein